VPDIDRLHFLNISLMSTFHTHWMPLLMLPLLIVHAPIYFLLFIFHMLLFETGLKTLVLWELPERRRLRTTV
jgi:hypothetical protein